MSTGDVSEALLERYQKVATPTVEDVLRRRGYVKVFMEGVHPLTPGRRLAARARTLRYLPTRPDLQEEVSRGEDSPPYQAMALCGPGDALVVDALRMPYIGVSGDVMLLQLKMQNAAGIVTDGGIRDVDTVATYGLAVFAGGRSHQGGPPHILPYEPNVAIQCGGVLVRPGDLVLGDDDGVLVVPASLAEEVLAEAEEREEMEEFVKEKIQQERCRPGRYYPITEEVARLFRQARGQGSK